MTMPTNIIKLTVLTTGLITGLLSTEIVSAQSTDEIVVEGKYLYTDQVNALKTPVPILDVPQSLSTLQIRISASRVLEN